LPIIQLCQKIDNRVCFFSLRVVTLGFAQARRSCRRRKGEGHRGRVDGNKNLADARRVHRAGRFGNVGDVGGSRNACTGFNLKIT
jgi:hypothetical protein